MSINHVELLLTAENHTVAREALDTDPQMQMRVTMDQETIEQYAENIESILEDKPIDVVIVERKGHETWYVVDGFHRYHAAQMAECEAIPARVMRGTYEQAVQFAMSANWKNGLRPKKDDAARSISMLLATAPDFGFDAKLVIKWIASFGIPKETARDNTKELREQIDTKRDAKIKELKADGLSNVKIASIVGCTDKTVASRLEAVSSENERDAQNPNTEGGSQSIPSDDTTPTNDCPWSLDEDDEDLTPAVNPADAFQTELDAHEAERQESTRLQDNSVVSPFIPTPEHENDGAHLVGLLNQLRAIRNSPSYQEQLTALKENASDYASLLIQEALSFAAELEA